MSRKAGQDVACIVEAMREWLDYHRDKPGARKVWWRGVREPATDQIGRALIAEVTRMHDEGFVVIDATGKAGTAQRAHVVEVV